MKKKKTKEILVIKIGNDERPAIHDDLVNFQNQLAISSNDQVLTLVTHHAINFEKVKLSNRIRTLVVKVGNEFRPASVEDIESIRLLFEQAILDNSLTIITHHAISFEYIDRKCLKRTKISSSPNIQNTFQTINNTIVGEENSSRMYVIVNK